MSTKEDCITASCSQNSNQPCHGKENENDKDAEKEPEKPVSHPMVIYLIATCATVGGLLFGYDTGIINGALLVIEEDFEMTSVWKESIVTSTVAAAAVFSILSGTLSDAIGRKRTVMFAALVFTIGGFIMAIAPSLEILLVGRFTVGAGIGVVSCIVPVYVSECAPKDIRGRLLTLNQLFITLGIVWSAVLAGAFQKVPSGWRWMLGLSVIPGAIQFIFFIFLPESPRYLVMAGRIDAAREVLKKIRKMDDIEEEFNEIVTSVRMEKDHKGLYVWKAIMTTPHVRRALFIGCCLQMFQQFCGINTVIYYSATILQSSGFSSSAAIWLSTIPFSINFLATFIGLWAVEALGRKMVLAASFLAIGVSCGVMVAGFVLASESSPLTFSFHDVGSFGYCAKFTTCNACLKLSSEPCGYCALNKGEFREEGACVMTHEIKKKKYAERGRCSVNSTQRSDMKLMPDFCPNEYASVPLVGLILFVLAFAPGAGPMPWTINAEIYPIWARSVATSISTLTNWVCNVIVSFFFMTMIKMFQAYGTFMIFMLLSILGSVFVLAMVPETKGKSLEEIEYLFMTAAARQEYKARKRNIGYTKNDTGTTQHN